MITNSISKSFCEALKNLFCLCYDAQIHTHSHLIVITLIANIWLYFFSVNKL